MYIVKPSFLKANRSHKIFKPVGITLHSTASPGATDEAETRYFNTHPDRLANAHAFIDWDSITQTLPYNEKGWHAGSHANALFLGVELCEPKGINPAQFKKVYDRAIWYFAWVFKNVLKISTVTKMNLMSHSEISKKWPTDTNHTDPVEYFKKYDKTVDMFRKDVQIEIKKQLLTKYK